ncbi:MAG: LamG domain-containing protein [Phycisphaerae bacterium]|jgi:hypothetical protein
MAAASSHRPPLVAAVYPGRRRLNARRGVALLLVTIAVFLSAVVAHHFLAAQGTAVAAARNCRDQTQARTIAESCLDLTLAYVKATPGWRAQVANGTWTQSAPFGGGTCTVVGEDGRDLDGDGLIAVPGEGDGNLSAAGGGEDDLFTLAITGQYKAARCLIRAVVTPANGGLAGSWSFDESSGTSVRDSSGNGLDGTIYNAGTPSWVPGKVNNGLKFSNATSYVSVNDHNALDLGQSGTLAIWFKMDTFKPFAGLIHKGVKTNFSDEAYTLQFWNDNKLYFGVGGTTGASSGTLSSNTPISNNQWYHVVATWDSTGMKLYLNGSLNASNSRAVNAMNSAGALILGAQLPVAYNSTYKNLTFNGTFDEAFVLNRALSASEVTSLYNLNPPGGGGGTAMKVDLVN